MQDDLRGLMAKACGVLVVWAAVLVLSAPLLHLPPLVAQWSGPVRTAAAVVALFMSAQLADRLFAMLMARGGKGKRPTPKVALDLVRVALFGIATLASLSLVFRQDLSGILTGSGLVLAVLGFAIRNVLADTFSGIALGLEAPFRIGDWVNIHGLAQGRIQEIGWRTTRLITRDSTYVILPNSQISLQRITNFSAPRQEYRDFIELTLPVEVPVVQAREAISMTLKDAKIITLPKGIDVQVTAYTPLGVTYRVKYWVPQYDKEQACRHEVYALIDDALRERKVALKTPASAGLATA